MDGTGRWHAEQAWLGHPAQDVLIEVEGGRIKSIVEGASAPHDAVALKGWTFPGFANTHSHAFQRLLRGEVESSGGDFWEWRSRMYRFADWDPADYFNHARRVFREMLEAWTTATEAMAKAGVLIDCAPLQPGSASTTVQVRDGQTLLTDGPAAEIKEQFGGYTLVECADLDEALKWAATLPAAADNRVEVRPVLTVEAPR